MCGEHIEPFLGCLPKGNSSLRNNKILDMLRRARPSTLHNATLCQCGTVRGCTRGRVLRGRVIVATPASFNISTIGMLLTARPASSPPAAIWLARSAHPPATSASSARSPTACPMPLRRKRVQLDVLHGHPSHPLLRRVQAHHRPLPGHQLVERDGELRGNFVDATVEGLPHS